MITLYSFSSPNGDVTVDEATLVRPFIVRPFQNHPFMTLGDYFHAVRNLVLREDGHSLSTLLSHLWKCPVEIADVNAVAIRYEKYGTLYHISSVEIATEKQQVRLTVSAALTDESKEALDREFGLLQRLGSEKSLSYLPQVYCKHAIQIQKGTWSETLLTTLSEWFENYHEWHFSRGKEGGERIIIWNTEGGYRFASRQEAYDIIRQATTILTFYYNTETYHRIFPWHHGGGDFVVRAAEGAVDVKLITARGYEPVKLPEQDQEISPLRAIMLFFFETTLKMRLDKYEGMGESTWADASVVGAATHGFFQALRTRETKGDILPVKVDELLRELRTLTEQDLKALLQSGMDEYRAHDPFDYRVILSHLGDHARDLYRAIQEQVSTKAG